MSTTETTAKPPRRRRRAKSEHQPDWTIGPCGRKVAARPSPFFAIAFADGSVLRQSHGALGRGACPDCIVDRLVEHGYVEYGTPLRAPFGMVAECKDGIFGEYSGFELCALLARLSLPESLLINRLHDMGEC